MKAYTKGAKRRNKSKGVTALYQQFEEQAQIATVERDDPMETVISARARQTGKPESEVLHPMLCFDAGRAIDAGARSKDEAVRMWDVFADMDAAHSASVYHTTGKPRSPAVSKMEFMPERFEVRHDFPIDLRTEDERHDAAMRRWREAKHKLGFLSGREWHSIMDAFWQNTALFDHGITVHGQTFVAAMRVLCEVVDTLENRR